MYTLNINNGTIICFYDDGKGEVFQSIVNASDYHSEALAIEDAKAKAFNLAQ